MTRLHNKMGTDSRNTRQQKLRKFTLQRKLLRKKGLVVLSKYLSSMWMQQVTISLSMRAKPWHLAFFIHLIWRISGMTLSHPKLAVEKSRALSFKAIKGSYIIRLTQAKSLNSLIQWWVTRCQIRRNLLYLRGRWKIQKWKSCFKRRSHFSMGVSFKRFRLEKTSRIFKVKGKSQWQATNRQKAIRKISTFFRRETTAQLNFALKTFIYNLQLQPGQQRVVVRVV